AHEPALVITPQRVFEDMQQALVAVRTWRILRTVHSRGKVVWQAGVCEKGSSYRDRVTAAVAQGTTDAVRGLESAGHHNRNFDRSANSLGILCSQTFDPVGIDDAVPPERLPAAPQPIDQSGNIPENEIVEEGPAPAGN